MNTLAIIIQLDGVAVAGEVRSGGPDVEALARMLAAQPETSRALASTLMDAMLRSVPGEKT